MAKENKTQVSEPGAAVPSSEPATGKQEVKEIVYENREEQDAQLSGVIADILSAEREAKHIIARAEENAKAIQHGGAGEMRALREANSRTVAEAKVKMTEDAMSQAAAEREKRVKDAKERGEKLIKQKEKLIAEQINRLFESLGGKA